MVSLRCAALAAFTCLAMAVPAWAAPFEGVTPGVDTVEAAHAAWGPPAFSKPMGGFTQHYYLHPKAPQGKIMVMVEPATGKVKMIYFLRDDAPRPIAELAAAAGVLDQAIAFDNNPQRPMLHLPTIGMAFLPAPGDPKRSSTTFYYHPSMAASMGLKPTAQRLGDYLAVKPQAPAAALDKQAAYTQCLARFKTLNDDFIGVVRKVTLGELPDDTKAEHDLAGDLFAVLQTITGKAIMQEMADDPSCIPDYLAEMREQTDLMKAKLAPIGPTRYARFVTGLDEALVAAGF